MGMTLGGHRDGDDRFRIGREPSEIGKLQFKVVSTTHFKVVCSRCQGGYLGEQYTAGEYRSERRFKKHLLKQGWSRDHNGWHHNECPNKNYAWEEWKKSTQTP